MRRPPTLLVLALLLAGCAEERPVEPVDRAASVAAGTPFDVRIPGFPRMAQPPVGALAAYGPDRAAVVAVGRYADEEVPFDVVQTTLQSTLGAARVSFQRVAGRLTTVAQVQQRARGDLLTRRLHVFAAAGDTWEISCYWRRATASATRRACDQALRSIRFGTAAGRPA